MNKIERAEQLRRALQLFAETLEDKVAATVPAVFDEWKVGVTLKKDKVVRYGTNANGEPRLYRVEQPHTTQADWTPDTTTALYTEICYDAQGYKIWKQPLGAHDAYAYDEIVRYPVDWKLYVSTMDANVYPPDVTGWKEYTE